MKPRFLLLIFFSFFFKFSPGQTIVPVTDGTPHHILSYGELQSIEDRTGKLQLADVMNGTHGAVFVPNRKYTPKSRNLDSYYWFRFRIKHNKLSNEHWILEFFDQTIDDIRLFETKNGRVLKSYRLGDTYKFNHREYTHKNFTIDLRNDSDDVYTYYLRVKSTQSASIIVVLRDIKWFIQYALDEYLIFGLFYGMVIVFSMYNLLMFFAIRQKQYLWYVLYNVSIGIYEMATDGIGFQYIWPNLPALNQYIFGIGLFLSSLFGLLFTMNFLYLRSKAPVLYKVLLATMALRTMFFIACLVSPTLFNLKFIEFIPLVTAFYCGIHILRRGYRPARFFVIGYSFLTLGFIVKLLTLFNLIPYGPLTHYSLSICFVLEMVLVSFAIGDNVRHLRKKKDKAQKRMIKQLQINERLTNTLNRELSAQVEKRTHELVEQAAIIRRQNEELSDMNQKLTLQSEEISRMNVLLEKDNQELHVNIEKVTRARVMSQEVDFNEFSQIYPDRETCFKYLADLKWEGGYECRRCGNKNYLGGQLPYSRRCTRCRYEESVITNTIFQNSRIPINKAFYMLFLIYTTKGKISSHKLSEILSIRQSTCWAYGSKMKKILELRKKELKNAGEKGWSKMVLEDADE